MTNPCVQAAVHEAGHAISHHVLGDQIQFVRIARDGRGRTRARPRADGRSPITSALTCLSGAAAEARLLGGGYAADCKIDIAHARNYLHGTGLTVEQVWSKALDFAEDHRDNIITVANGLLEQGGLDGDELAALLRNGREWQSPRWR